jgi:hypothetical protein
MLPSNFRVWIVWLKGHNTDFCGVSVEPHTGRFFLSLRQIGASFSGLARNQSSSALQQDWVIIVFGVPTIQRKRRCS